MARKKEMIEVPDASYGRDYAPKRKTFLITEWPAERFLKWLIKAGLAYNRDAGEMPLTNAFGAGVEGIIFLFAQTMLRGKMREEEVSPVLDELLDCVQIVRDPSANDIATGMPVAFKLMPNEDIEEIKTAAWLRSEVLRVHTNFSVLAMLSKLISAIMTPKASRKRPTSTS